MPERLVISVADLEVGRLINLNLFLLNSAHGSGTVGLFVLSTYITRDYNFKSCAVFNNKHNVCGL